MRRPRSAARGRPPVPQRGPGAPGRGRCRQDRAARPCRRAGRGDGRAGGHRGRVRGRAALRRPPPAPAARAGPGRAHPGDPGRRPRRRPRPGPARGPGETRTRTASWSRWRCSACSPRRPRSGRCCAWSTRPSGGTAPRPRRSGSPPGGWRPRGWCACSRPATATPASSPPPACPSCAWRGSTGNRRRPCRPGTGSTCRARWSTCWSSGPAATPWPCWSCPGRWTPASSPGGPAR
jgi:hypothetical protein